MAQRRKREMSSHVDDSKNVFSTFQSTANTLSEFYSQSVKQLKLAFSAGQEHSLLKMHEWLVSQLKQGRMVTIQEVLAYLQDNLSNCDVAGHGLLEQFGGSVGGSVLVNAEAHSTQLGMLADQLQGAQINSNQDTQMEETVSD